MKKIYFKIIHPLFRDVISRPEQQHTLIYGSNSDVGMRGGSVDADDCIRTRVNRSVGTLYGNLYTNSNVLKISLKA